MTDSVFGLSAKALELCEDRSVMLSNNIVNGSTPHYKARDMDFQKMLKSTDAQTGGLLTTDPKHIKASDVSGTPDAMYRVPMQKSLDGNTVDEEIERKNFIENALHYQVNLTFIENKSDQLMKAIKGE